MHHFFIPALLVLAIGCKSKSNADLIQGTWKMKNPEANQKAQMIITGKELLYKTEDRTDTLKYVMSADQKQITTTEPDGRVTVVNIVKATADEIIFLPENSKDTVFLGK